MDRPSDGPTTTRVVGIKLTRLHIERSRPIAIADNPSVATPGRGHVIGRRGPPESGPGTGRISTNNRDPAWRAPTRPSPRVSPVDSFVGGLGGCPFAPGASGNIATTETSPIYCGDSGVATGIDLAAAIDAARVARNDIVGHDLPSALLRAGDRIGAS